MNRGSFFSIEQLTASEIEAILDTDELFEQNPNRRLLEGKVVATLFFEPSTRTRLRLSLIHT